MSSTYTVKSGDTLGEIARRHGVKTAEIQALNPLIKDPNHISPGWALKLPGAAPKPELPPPMHANNTSWTVLRGQPECQQELVDVVHITGEPHFYVLTEQQSNALKKAISAVQTLMDELHPALSTVPADMPCKTLQDPEASCPCAQCVKEAWSIKAEEAGVLTRDPKPRAATAPSLSAAQRLQEDLATLQQARDWYQDYAPGFFATTRFESNWTSLQARKVLELDREIGTLRATLATQKRAESPHSSTSASSAGPDLKRAQKAVGVEKQQGIHSKTGVDIVEIILFSDPTRRHYIPMAYRDTTLWITRVPLRVMAGKPFNRQLATDLIKDIRQAIGTGRKTSVLGGLELKISSWTSQEDNLLNALHREASWTMGERDAVPYAVSAEAHAWRFAASASAGVNNWNPKQGNIDVGVKSSATFSFGEASGSLNRYFPSQGGYVANMAYRNALGQEVRRPFGVFRLSGTLELSCFTGVKGQVEAGVQTQYKPTETPAGATALLGTPTLEVGRSSNIGVKCEGFVGAQAGGALSGSFDWVEPDKYGTGKIIAGQANASSNWVKLAEVKMEGNVAWGVGGSGEFGISIANDRLAINCKASLVLGPGAGGGFGTVVDIEQVGKLVLLFCNALADMDYRHLLGVTQDAFSYLASGLFQVMTSPGKLIGEAFEDTAFTMDIWWKTRTASKAEAQNLASYVLAHSVDKTIKVREQLLPFDLLPPETLGPMVYLLTEGFVESFNEQQEKALVILLSEIRTWRHFIEVLEHCSPKAEKIKAMKSLERINALLDGHEQNQFNWFIDSLVINQSAEPSTRQAWKPSNAWRKEKRLLAARNSGRFDGLA